MKRDYLLLLGILMAFFIAGCQMGDSSSGGDNNPGGTGDDGPTVYTCGGYGDYDNQDIRPCYWKGTERVDLPVPESAEYGRAKDIIVVDDIVYCVGDYQNESDEKVLCLWVGTERTELPLPADTIGEVQGIDIEDGVVYIGGYSYPESDINDYLCCWIDGEFEVLGAIDGFVGDTFQMTVEDGVIYVVQDEDGYYIDGTYVENPAGSDGWVNGIDVKNGTIYLAGNIDPDSDHSTYDNTACFWAGSVLTKLSAPDDTESNVYAIDATGDTIYSVGKIRYDEDTVSYCYWSGTEYTLLPTGEWDGCYSGDLMVIDDSVVCAGALFSESPYKENACYWIDSNLTILPVEAGYNSYINAVYVVE